MVPSDHLKGDTNKITAKLFVIKLERTLKMPNCVCLFNFGLVLFYFHFCHLKGMRWFILVMLT